MITHTLESLASHIVQRKQATIVTVALITALLAGGVGHLAIIIDPDQTLPQSHPYQVVTKLVDRVFGNKLAVIIGLTPRQGSAFQPSVLRVVNRITDELEHDPGVVKANIVSLTAPKVKDILGTEEGLQVGPLVPKMPTSEADADVIRMSVARNPAYKGLLISSDERTTAIVADFRKDEGGFRAIASRVEKMVSPWRSTDLQIEVAGQPIFLAMTEVFSDRIAFLFPLALVVIGLVHFEAFRSWQGLVLPLVTGLVATIWALGFMGWTRTPLDAFNASTPILILAVSAGHAVQILKRYYEEYTLILDVGEVSAAQANHLAIVKTMRLTGPVMLTAGLTAAVSFASLMVFQIATIRTFGLFTALGIVSALIIELTLIPALRAALPPPGPELVRREARPGAWDRAAFALATVVVKHPGLILFGSSLLLLLAISGGTKVHVDNALRSYFSSSLDVRKEDSDLNSKLAGNNVLSIVIEGRQDDAMKSPAVLQAIEETQRFLEREPAVGKTISLADFIRQIDRAVNNDPSLSRPLPDSGDLIAQYLLLYSMSGSPSDFNSYVDTGYRRAVITAYVKQESSAYLERLAERLRVFVAKAFPSDVDVSIGGNVMSSVALNSVLVESKIMNIVQISGAVFVISAILFRSLLGGLLVLLPLGLAVAANFGLMGWAGIPLQVATATVSAMAVGIGADYAIYILYRLREEAKLACPESAMMRTLQSAGKAVMFVATAVAAGYSVMMLSWGFLIHFWLGLLISFAMLVSAAAALFTLTALVIKIRPAFIFASAAPTRLASPLRRASLLSLVASVAFPLTFAASAHAQGLSAEEVMRRNFVATKVVDSTSDATFTLISSDGQQRQRHLRNWTKLREDGVSNMRLARFISPPDVRGTATLTVENSAGDDDIWIYLPALKRVRRLLASNKKDSYVGTDFSYGDFIGLKVEDWRHNIVRQESVDGVICYVINSVPVTSQASETSGYSRRLQWIRMDNFVTVKGQYFDTEGRLWKSYMASDLRLADAARNRWQPMRLESRDELANHRTIIVLEGFRANQGLDSAVFNPRTLDQER